VESGVLHGWCLAQVVHKHLGGGFPVQVQGVRFGGLKSDQFHLTGVGSKLSRSGATVRYQRRIKRAQWPHQTSAASYIGR
jgi:hypothetical protein